MRPEFQEIVDEVSRLLARQAILEDREFNLVAFSPHGPHIDEVRQKSILQRRSTVEVKDWFEQFGIARSDEPVRTPVSEEFGALARLCLPARSHGVTYGYLWMLDEPGEIDKWQVPAAMELAQQAGALMAQQARAGEDLEYKLRDVLSTDPEAVGRAAHDLDALGIIGRQVPVVAIELRFAPPVPAQAVSMNVWRLPRSVLAAFESDHTTLLVPLGTTGLQPALTVADQAWHLAAEGLDAAERDALVVGIGAARPDLGEARLSWQEARVAALVAERVRSLRPVAVWPQLGVYRLLACGPESVLADAVMDPAVLRLLELDDPDLLKTALGYLGSGGNVQETAAALNVHRQTIYYRVQKIEHVTGLDLSRGDHRLVLHLGLVLGPALSPPDGPLPTVGHVSQATAPG